MVGKSQRLKVTYRLKLLNYGINGFEASVCSRAFSYIYGLTNWARKKLINSVKYSHTLVKQNKRRRVDETSYVRTVTYSTVNLRPIYSTVQYSVL